MNILKINELGEFTVDQVINAVVGSLIVYAIVTLIGTVLVALLYKATRKK